MGLFKSLGNIFRSAAKPATPFYTLQVRCMRCGEEIQAQVNLHNDLSPSYDDEQTSYYCRKVLIGDQGLCFQRIEVELKFDANRKLINRQIQGGQFIDEEA